MMAIVLKTGCTLLVVGGLSTASVAGLSDGEPMVGFHEDAIMTASDGSVAGWLGWDVDFEGSVLIAGAPRQGGGHAVIGYLSQWGALSTDEIAASDAVETDAFGYSVAIGGLGESGGVAFVGAPYWARDGAPFGSGAVYVFTSASSGVPTEVGTITPASGPLQRAFGWSLDFDGDGTRLAVGAFYESMEEDDAGQLIDAHGAVYVYDIGPDGLQTDEQRVVCEIPHQSQGFGVDMSLDGDQMAVGAPKDSTVAYQGGAVYHFERQSSNEWLQTQLLAPADLANADGYGAAVSLVGDTLIVGCPERDIVQEGDDDPTAGHGVVYVYARVDGVFEEVQQILPPQPQALSAWGASMSFDGQHLVIGERQWTNVNLIFGACCNGENCTVTIEANCNGDWLGEGTDCIGNPCYVAPTGACCTSGSCFITTEADCSGNWLGEGTDCTGDPCDGACCINVSCSITTEAGCNGDWFGEGTDCSDTSCDVPLAGACCIGQFCSVKIEDDCSGDWIGEGTDCSGNPCYVPLTGACCIGENCSITTKAGCNDGDGDWFGEGTDCSGNPCGPPYGANVGLAAVYELGMDGTFTLGRVIAASDGEDGDGFAYSVAISEERILVGSIENGAVDGDETPNGGMAYIYRATCSGDIDGDGAIDSDDLIEVLTDWSETGVLPADVVQDYEVGIFDLLTMLEYYGDCN